jgi:hypothetical protein
VPTSELQKKAVQQGVIIEGVMSLTGRGALDVTGVGISSLLATNNTVLGSTTPEDARKKTARR